jgi:hypothetical protein
MESTSIRVAALEELKIVEAMLVGILILRPPIFVGSEKSVRSKSEHS